jgi:uncharacterized oligopeptide transporter (OPT) family protein
MAFAIQLLHSQYGGVGSADLPAPQAGLMAALSEGIIGGEMAWPLVIMGMLFGFGLILIGAPSVMLIAVGMYLPLYVTSGIFVGGLIKSIVDKTLQKRNYNKEKVENTGILLSSGLIAGEAIVGIIIAFTIWAGRGEAILPRIIDGGNPWLGLIIFCVITFVLIRIPLKNGRIKT